MKRIVLLLIMISLLLCACTPARSDQPTTATTPSESQQTNPTLPSETQGSNVESTEPQPTIQSTMSIDRWQVAKPEYLDYETYFSIRRDISTATKSWVKGNQKFIVTQLENTWVVFCPETKEFYVIPNAGAYNEYSLLGADGRYGYLYFEGTLIRMDLATGEPERLLHYPICRSASFILGDNLVLYYSVCVNNTLEIGRIYLPELKYDSLYKTQGVFYNVALQSISNTTEPLSWSMYNPDFVELLEKELANPESQYQLLSVNGPTGPVQYDYTKYWKGQEGISQMLTDFFLLHHIQDTSGIRALLQYTYNPMDGSLTKQTGVLDSCWHGSGYPHDHFNPDVTTAPAPEVIMGQWQNLNEVPSFALQPADSATDKADCVLVTGVDSGKYVYVKTDGDYQKLTDTPVSWMQDTGSCVLYASADQKTLFAATYDGSQTATLHKAARGEITASSPCMEQDRLVILDGDTLVEIDLVNRQCRELVRHQHLQDYYIDTGEDRVYFVVYVGLYVSGHTIDLNTGELGGRYRL